MEKVLQYVEELYERSTLSPHRINGLGYGDLEAYPPESFLEESAGLFAHLSSVVKKEFKSVQSRGRVLEYCYFFLCFSVKSGLMARIDQYNDLGNLRVIDQNDYDPNNYAFFRTYVTALEKGFTFKTKQQSWQKRDVSEAVLLFEACGNLLPLFKFGGEKYLEEVLPMMEKYEALGHFRFILEFGKKSDNTLPPLSDEEEEYSPEDMVSVNRSPKAFELEDSIQFTKLSPLEQSLLLGHHYPWTGNLPLSLCTLRSISWREVSLPFQERALDLLALWKASENSEDKSQYHKEYLEICDKLLLIANYEEGDMFPSSVVAEDEKQREQQRLAGVSIKDVAAQSGVIRQGQLAHRKLEGSTASWSIANHLYRTSVELSSSTEEVKQYLHGINELSAARERKFNSLTEEKAKLDELMKQFVHLEEMTGKYQSFSEGYKELQKGS